jgi:Glucodextranase, domain B
MRRSSLALLLALATGCASNEEERAYGDPTALSLPTESLGIRAWVVSPTTRVQTGDSAIALTLGAYVDGSNDPLDVWIGKLEADASGEAVPTGLAHAEVVGAPGPDQRFTASVGLLHGSNQLFARIASADRSRVRTLSFTLDYTGDQPGLSFGTSVASMGDPCTGEELTTPITNQRNVCVHGRVSSKAGGAVNAAVQGVPVTLDASGRFQTVFSLPPNQASTIQLTAGQAGTVSTLSRTLVEDEQAPSFQLTSNARETSEPAIRVAGNAQDSSGVVEVALETQQGGRIVLANTGSFEHEVQLVVGTNTVTLVATDGAGNEARQALNLSRVRVLRLGAPRRNAGTQNIEVDRQALGELLNADDQRQIELVAVDLEAAVTQALERIRDPAKFSVDTSSWGVPERNLQRILRTTPDVADLTGTSVEELLEIASGVGLPSPRVLAKLLGIEVTDYVLELEVLTKVVIDGVLGTHPNISRDASGKPVLTVSMYDVLQDLTTLGVRFGPSGSHPGFLTGNTFSQVLEPGFLLSFAVSSNLAQYDAVDLARATKDYLFLLEGERVLDFNVLEDEFSAVGLVDEPSIDLNFSLHESPINARAGSNRTAAPDASEPGFYRGNGQGFSLPAYLFENVAAEAGYRLFRRKYESTNFAKTDRYDAGSIVDAAVLDWDHGWVTIRTAGGLGAPPPPLYVWDFLMEVGEARLHDEGVAQGAGDMAFPLRALPVGLTADQLVEKLRPKLHEQEDKLSELLVGNAGLASSKADVYYVPADGMNGALLFRTADDAGGGVSYASPGFFSDAQLSQKVSVTGAAYGSTDAVHEKVEAKVGAVYYMQDEDGVTYELRIKDRDSTSIGVEVRRPGVIL